jgi:hypothetical protein
VFDIHNICVCEVSARAVYVFSVSFLLHRRLTSRGDPSEPSSPTSCVGLTGQPTVLITNGAS